MIGYKLFKYILLFLFLSHSALAEDLAVMLFIKDSAIGDTLYHQHLHKLGFKRHLYHHDGFKNDYHVSIGYIDNVKDTEVAEVKGFIHQSLAQNLQNDVTFEFGAASLLGANTSYIVAIPSNTELFSTYNRLLNMAMKHYKNGKYKLKKYSRPENYIPHMTLNARLHKEIHVQNLPMVLQAVSKELQGTQLILSKDLVIN